RRVLPRQAQKYRRIPQRVHDRKQRAENQHRALHHFIHRPPPAAPCASIPEPPASSPYGKHPAKPASHRHRVILPSSREFIHKPANISLRRTSVSPVLPNR